MFLSASSRSRLLLALLFGLLFFACKKDSNLLNSDISTPAFVHPPKYAISVADAREFYKVKASVPSLPPSSFSGASTTGRLILNNLPQWDKAFESQTQMGRPVVLVPLGDSILNTQNQGRVNAKMQFSRITPDTIAVEIVVSIADSSWLNNLGTNPVTLDNFTGVFVVTDLGGYFNYGLRVVNGQSTSWIKGLSAEYYEPSDTKDRTGGDVQGQDCLYTAQLQQACIPYNNGGGDGQSLEIPDCEWVNTDINLYLLDCNDAPASGSSNTGGTFTNPGGPSGAGGNSGSNSNNGNGGIMATLFKDVPLSQALAAGMSVDYFVQHGGQLPVDIEVARCLESMQSQCNYTSSQLSWFTSFAQHACPAKGYLEGNNYDQATVNAIKQTIDAMSGPRRPVLNFNTIVQVVELQKKVNFTAEQLEWVVMNTDVLPFINDVLSEDKGEHLIRGYFNFMASESYSATASDALRSYLYLRANDVFTEGYDDENPDPGLLPVFFVFDTQDQLDEIIIRASRLYKDAGIAPNDNSAGAWVHRGALFAEAYYDVVGKGFKHTVLDLCGLVPGYGEACDAVNGIVYWFEGDNENALISGASLIPFAGWAASGKRLVARFTASYNGVTYSLRMSVKNGVIDFGQRSKLRTVLGITNSANEAHHLVPWEVGQHSLVQKGAECGSNGGYHLNHANNGKELPKYRDDFPDGVHANHPEYNKGVKEKLDELETELIKQHGSNIPPEVARAKLISLENALRYIIDQNSSVKINDLKPFIDALDVKTL